jgi:hypothetical protein
LIDGKGLVHECQPSDDLFKAAIGGVGAVGIITEVVVQAVPRFNVEQKFEISDLSFVESNFDRLLKENDHLSLYMFPFTQKCQNQHVEQNQKAEVLSWACSGIREYLSGCFARRVGGKPDGVSGVVA